MSISPGSEAMELQRLPWLKYYTVLKGKSRFTLVLNDAKNTDYINFCLKQFL